VIRLDLITFLYLYDGRNSGVDESQGLKRGVQVHNFLPVCYSDSQNVQSSWIFLQKSVSGVIFTKKIRGWKQLSNTPITMYYPVFFSKNKEEGVNRNLWFPALFCLKWFGSIWPGETPWKKKHQKGVTIAWGIQPLLLLLFTHPHSCSGKTAVLGKTWESNLWRDHFQ